jgi:hypothetical protein
MKEESMEQKNEIFILAKKNKKIEIWNLDEKGYRFDNEESANSKLNEKTWRGTTMAEEGWIVVKVLIVFTPIN